MTMLDSTAGIIRLCGLVVAEIILIALVLGLVHLLAALILRRAAAMTRNEALRERCRSLQRLSRRLAAILAALLILGVLAFDAWLVWRGEDALAYTLHLIASVPVATWWALGWAVVKIIAAVIGARLAVKLIRKAMAALEAKAKAWEGLQANDRSIGAFFHGLTQVMVNVLWMFVLVFAFGQLRLPDGLTGLLYKGITIYLIIAVGLTVVRITAVIVDTLDALSQRYAEQQSWHHYYQQLRPLIPLFRRCLEWALWIGVGTMVLEQLQTETLAQWGPRLLQAIGIFFAGRVCIEIGHLFIDRHLTGREGIDDVERRRLQTIQPLIKNVFKYAALFIILVLMLRSLEFDIMPFLAGAGILGVVIGLGAQPLIHDVVSGFFIIFEHIYLVGDVVEGGGARGEVIAIDFRTTRIRDADGRLHVLRNGDMRQVVNYSKEFTFAPVEVPIGYDQPVAPVIGLLTELGARLAEEDEDVLGPTEVRGIVDFGESGMTIRTVTRVKPGCHASVAARYRLRVKEAFDARGIRMPVQRHEIRLDAGPGDYGRLGVPGALPQF